MHFLELKSEKSNINLLTIVKNCKNKAVRVTSYDMIAKTRLFRYHTV